MVKHNASKHKDSVVTSEMMNKRIIIVCMAAFTGFLLLTSLNKFL